MVYNAAGDLEFVFTIPNSNPPWNNPTWYENRASFYDAAGRLRAAEWRYALWSRGAGIPEGENTWQVAFEDFRYDALGRRVLVRERRAGNVKGWTYPMPHTLSKVRRVVWEGPRELWEIQMPGRYQDSTAGIWENDTLPVAPEPSPQYATPPQSDYYFDPHPRYGRVGYVYAGPIDEPISITKLGSTDFAYPNSQVYTFAAPFTVVPHWNWRGQADYGLFADGTYQHPEGSHWIKTAWRHRAFSLAQGTGSLSDVYGQSFTWLGTLVSDKEDATFTLYRRNRYVDPLTGQFTQEDPAGLGGGINLYGFGSGDAINFSDPFGLYVVAIGRAANQAIEKLLAGSATFRRIYGALQSADQSRVAIVIRQARSGLEFRLLASNGPAYTERDAGSASGRVIFDPEGSDRLVTLFAHEIVHAAGYYSEEVGNETKVGRDCRWPHPNTNNPCVVPIENQIWNEMNESRKQDSKTNSDASKSANEGSKDKP